MPFAILTTDKPDSAALRDRHQAAHKLYLDEHKHLLLAAGAMLDDEGSSAHGGILLLATDDRKEAEAFVSGDPFSHCGLFGSVRITRWRKAFFDGRRLVDL